jgi:murein DD-endopeptidase MepM/ murein hydrolase activator NlpD
MRNKTFIFIIAFTILTTYCATLDMHALPVAHALTIDELKLQIEAKRLEKARIEEENKKLEAQIAETAKQAATLQGAVKSLETTQKKLENDLKVTQTKISSTELSIQKLGFEITDTQESIKTNQDAISESLRNLYESERRSLLEDLLQYKNVSQVWDGVETLKRFQETIRQRTRELGGLKDDLEEKKTENESHKVELVDYKGELSDKKVVVEQSKKAQSTLLSQTKNKESEYKKMLERNIELGKKFEQELFMFESELQFAIDKSKLPTVREGVLSWPLDNVLITQRFGKTVDSKRLYVSGTHNGVDFRASMGTAVKSVLSGVVEGAGNTDDQAGCYSYGRWVLIKHPNGLSSLYAHLSTTRVTVGQSVSGGEIIGYSGGQPGVNGSGYSTGPHLHLGLYASEGVRIQKYAQSNFCKQVDIPVASSNAYLDPLIYLPPL